MIENIPIWGYILVALGLTHVTIASVTIFLHRHQAHKSLALSPVASHFFRFWLWLTTGIVTKEWVAIHRKHHARVESADDPHSPQQLGIKRVLWQGAELYRAEALNQETLEKFGHDTPDDWLERQLYSRHSFAGLGIMLIANLLLWGPVGITVWAVQMAWIPFFAAGVINGLGHWWGYRNFEPMDASTNIIPLGIVIGGEELHNNHHAFASSARFSSRWYEFDLGWFYIRALQVLGMARVKKVAPRLVVGRKDKVIDVETLRTIVNSRFHVMSHYARDVIKRVYQDEKHNIKNASRRLRRYHKKLLTRHHGLLDDRGRQKLESLLAESETLKVVYEYSQRLQQIWHNKSASQEGLVASLKEWCSQAEQSGIDALADFAATLRAYRLQPA